MTVLLIDTYSLFFRSFHALPPMNTLAGEPTNAVYGFSSLLLKMLREQKPHGVAFAVDRPEPTFRHQSFPEYKGTRETIPSPLVMQLRTLERLFTALDLPRYSALGFEADDVLATLADELSARGERALIATGDRDMMQLIDPRVEVLFHGQRGKPAMLYDEAAVQKRFGIPASRLPLYAALLGDTSDNIPKVKGIGPVAAQKLATQFADVASLLAGLEQVPAKLRSVLQEHQAQLRASEQLILLRRDVPLPDGEHHGMLTPSAVQHTVTLFEELEFKSLIPRLHALVR